MGKMQITLENLKAFHDEFDDQISKYKTVCSKGCSHCCYQFVPAMSFEVNYIKDAVKNLKESIKKKVKQQYENAMNHFLQNTPDGKILEYHDVYTDYAKLTGKDWIPCPLLVDDCCAIYAVRPFTCHLHFQLDDPMICKQNNIRDAAPEALQMMGKFMKFLVTTGDMHLVPIIIILKDIFDKKRKIKALPKQKYKQLKI